MHTLLLLFGACDGKEEKPGDIFILHQRLTTPWNPATEKVCTWNEHSNGSTRGNFAQPAKPRIGILFASSWDLYYGRRKTMSLISEMVIWKH
jgi:hypothetical protein